MINSTGEKYRFFYFRFLEIFAVLLQQGGIFFISLCRKTLLFEIWYTSYVKFIYSVIWGNAVNI